MFYREAAKRCEMCQVEDPPELATHGGLQLCPRCRGEDYTTGLRAWGLKLYLYDEEVGSVRNRRRIWTASAVLPTVIELGAAGALLRAERFDTKIARWLGRTDPTVGADSFDKAVWVEQLQGKATAQLLGDPTVQEAVVVAVKAAHRVHINAHRVSLRSSSAQLGFDPAEALEPMRWAAVAVAVAMERWARGAPGAALCHAQCRPREPAEWPDPPPLRSCYVIE